MCGSIEGHVTEKIENFSVCAEQRLDVLVSRHLGVTRSFAQKLIRNGRVELRKITSISKIKPSYKPNVDTIISVSVPPPETLDIEPEDVPFDVIYEDDYLLVINKPAGLVVHPAPGHWRGTLVHGLLFRYPNIGPFNNVARPGIVHRLDAGTSGLMLVAREQKTMELLQKAFAERQIGKKYIALVHGSFAQTEGIIEKPIGRHPHNRLKMAVVDDGRPSVTGYRVLWSRRGVSLVMCNLFTGRTHQIRVHMSDIGHPLIGDVLYGGKDVNSSGRVFLHSWKLAFTHPVTGVPMSFTSYIPREFLEVKPPR